MAAVAGVLLDHVHEDLTHRDLLSLAGQWHRRPKVIEPFDAPLGVGDLLAPCRPRVVNDGRISDSRR